MPVPLGNLGINATMGPSYMLTDIILTLWENLGGRDGDGSEGFTMRTEAVKVSPHGQRPARALWLGKRVVSDLGHDKRQRYGPQRTGAAMIF